MNEQAETRAVQAKPFRTWFKKAVEAEKKWREKAAEDYAFYAGDQWAKEDLAALKEQQRPAITINKVRPLIALLSGWQRLNRYEPDFLPRTADDLSLCKVRKGLTKFVLDRSDYEYKESRIFLDGIICGRGWLAAEYEWNYEKLDGDIVIRRVSPFDMYVDPEAKEPDLADAEYVCRARWVTKEKIKNVYPEQAEVIEGFVDRYDKDEQPEKADAEPLWYSRESKKCRLVEIWYREHYAKTIHILPDGVGVVPSDDLPSGTPVPEGTRTVRLPQARVKYVTLLGDVVLEDGDSPYRHGDFPFVPFVADYTGEVADEFDVQGIIRSLKDPQREVNKRRSQSLHIINTTANPVYWVKEGTMAPGDFQRFKERGAIAGGVFKYAAERPLREEAAAFPMALAQMEEISTHDLRAISGINPEMLGEAMPSGTSGKAIELRQRQSITQIAALFDNLRLSKKRLLSLLWGEPGRPGLIPQYYNEAKVIRIVGEGGKPEFVPVNQPEVDSFGLATAYSQRPFGRRVRYRGGGYAFDADPASEPILCAARSGAGRGRDPAAAHSPGLRSAAEGRIAAVPGAAGTAGRAAAAAAAEDQPDSQYRRAAAGGAGPAIRRRGCTGRPAVDRGQSGASWPAEAAAGRRAESRAAAGGQSAGYPAGVVGGRMDLSAAWYIATQNQAGTKKANRQNLRRQRRSGKARRKKRD